MYSMLAGAHGFGRRAAVCATLALVVLAALPVSTGEVISGNVRPAAKVMAAVQPGEWPAYHRDMAKTGSDPNQYSLNPLSPAWTAPLDGDVYASPVIAGGVVIAATENNTVYAFHVADGSAAWKNHLGTPVTSSTLPCGDIGPVTGISGTPVIDTTTSTVYVVAYFPGNPNNHVLYALDLGSGTVKWSHEVNPVSGTPNDHQERGALGFGNGEIYVPYGGLSGDCGNYHGQIISFPANGQGNKQAWTATAPEAGMWNTEGPAVDPFGNVFNVTGNGAGGSAFGDQESAIKLNGITMAKEDSFYPGDWATLDRGDKDMGSMGISLLDNNIAFTSGKSGIGYLLDQNHMGGQDGSVFNASICNGSFGGPAYASPILYVPCTNGVTAVKVNAAARSFSVLWTHGAGNASPIVAGGLVWALGGGNLVGMDPNSGATVVSKAVGGSNHFATPAAAAGRIFLPLSTSLMVLQGPAPGSSGSSGTSDTGRPWPGGSDAVGVAAPSTNAYFAEGFTGQNFDEYLTVENPGAAQTLTVQYLFADGSAPTSVQHSLGANARTTISVNADVGSNRQVSAHLSAPNPFVAERPMYFDYPGGITGGDDVMGVQQPVMQAYFAEGTTLPGFYEYLTLENPNGAAATVNLDYSTESGPVPTKTVNLPANSRRTVDVSKGDTTHAVNPCDISATCGVGPGQEGVSVHVSVAAGGGIVVERPMYFDYNGRPGGHVASGATAPATDLDLAEGFVSANFDEYLSIFNPNGAAATVNISYYLTGGGTTPQQVTVGANSRATIHVNDFLASFTSASVHVHSSQPVVVERPMYFNYSGWTGGHDAVAVPTSQLASTAYFAEGSTLPQFRTFLSIENPNGAAVPATITYYTNTGKTIVNYLTLPANSRSTVQVFAGFGGAMSCSDPTICGAGSGWEGVSAVVQATGGQHILAERPMYFDF